MAEFEVNHVSICSHFEREDESLSDYLKTVSKLDTPGDIRNRIVDIDEEDEMESALGFGVMSGGNPLESSMNYLEFDGWGDNTYHIHMSCDREYISEFMTLYSDILGVVGEVEVDPIGLFIDINEPFENLGVEIDITLPEELGQDIHQVTGARFDLGDADSDYLLQKDPGTGDARIRYGSGPLTVDSDSAENLIQSELENVSDLIEGL